MILIHCIYCELEMLLSESVFNTQLKGRICKDCDKELTENDNNTCQD